MRTSASLALSLVALVSSACQHGDTPTGLSETEALLEAAPALSFDSALDDMGLSADERERLGGLASDLHTAMLDAHDAMGRFHEAGEEEREAAHHQVKAQLEGVHARHQAFVESMTAEQQTAFAAALHSQMADAHGGMEDHGHLEGMDHGSEGIDHGLHEGGESGRHHVRGHGSD